MKRSISFAILEGIENQVLIMGCDGDRKKYPRCFGRFVGRGAGLVVGTARPGIAVLGCICTNASTSPGFKKARSDGRQTWVTSC